MLRRSKSRRAEGLGMEERNGGWLLMGTVGKMGLLAFSTGASTVQGPVTKVSQMVTYLVCD